MLELTKVIRDSRREVDDIKLETAKKLAEDEGKIREDVRKKVEEEHSLKEREINTKLQAALKLNEQLNQKLEQGSQQAQGESLELEVEDILRREFPGDIITEIAKGVRGADTLQRVIDKHSRECGFILWESKNAKWSSAWIAKLREDQRNAKAQMGVLVSVNLPADIKGFTFRDGVWITNRSSVIGLAWALRINIAQVYTVKKMSEGKNEKMEELFKYLTGIEFRQRVEAIVEGFTNLQGDIEKEKRWFQVKWANQEKEIRKIIDSTHGMYGDLQGVTGRSLPEIKGLKLIESNSGA
ncbi:MAG: DUF2130 domain-containing protein [Candidatus Gottesmanbacteria bacterium]|nr:DUF2130 domain-containing protein [Candidatus Gottesmanbacteria bacterium]